MFSINNGGFTFLLHSSPASSPSSYPSSFSVDLKVTFAAKPQKMLSTTMGDSFVLFSFKAVKVAENRSTQKNLFVSAVTDCINRSHPLPCGFILGP